MGKFSLTPAIEVHLSTMTYWVVEAVRSIAPSALPCHRIQRDGRNLRLLTDTEPKNEKRQEGNLEDRKASCGVSDPTREKAWSSIIQTDASYRLRSPNFSAWVAAAYAIERPSVGDRFHLALFTGQRQTDRLIMRNESYVEGQHAFRQSKTGELVDIKEAPQLSARLNASRARIKEVKLRLQLNKVPHEFVVNEDNGEPHTEARRPS